MTKRKQVAENKDFNAVDAVRQGWLAYLGAYGVAFERAKPALKTLSEKYAEFFGELVEKGEEIEETAKEQIVDVRDRAKGVYGAGFEKVRDFIPARAANDRVKELEAEVAALKKKVATKTKRAATKTAKAA